ncbi:PVC-type heme-binding CxxCH protein [Membranihabitans maritimus]|uniref:PVC-type heme-binding CxxCH protein n=1 Tax=Membranihabitans maritimus TaxID=2904244 RepID=UPI001F22CA26|nr:PVC-type heme-binding CxxCH protein [Membranihabitans maritimus]
MIANQSGLVPGVVLVFFSIFLSLQSCQKKEGFEFYRGDRIAIVGNGLAERMQHDGWLESYIQVLNPEDSLVFRNLGYSGDQIHYRPRAHEGFGDSDSHLSEMKASIIFAFFGYNESFHNTPEEFREKVEAYISHIRMQKYDSEAPPRVVLFSPIAHEDLESPDLPDGSENNKRLKSYTTVLSEVANKMNVKCIDLFSKSEELYKASEEPLTINGIHLSSKGNKLIGEYIAKEVSGGVSTTIEDEDLDSLRSAVVEKNELWFQKYRASSGNDVWGIRSAQDGNFKTLQRELEMLEVMVKNRDHKIWARANGEDIEIDDSNVPEPLIVGTHITRDVEYIGPVEAIDRMTVPSDLKVNLFASEEEFPEIVNPVAMQVDTKGRIWVASWGDYPKWEPMTPMNDRLVFLTDEDKDGKADKATTFAYVSHPTGFEFWNGGVIVVSAPDILFLEDTDGDGKADKQTRILGGLGADDTHHTANNLIFGPDGYIYYQRGIFILENIETPYRISEESGTPGLYRFNPRTYDYSFVVENTPNAHGISFDKWGNQFITDGTSGRAFQVYYNRTVTAKSDVSEFAKRPLFEQTVRPVTSNQILSSAQFPDKYQNNFLIYNVIGFQGIKRYRLDYKGEGVVEGVEVGNLLFTGDDPTFDPHSEAKPRVIPENYKGDPNFRPTDGVIGMDGALYFSDWQNAVITHSPYNLRDLSRDKAHGRIYRITAKGRPLQDPVVIDGAPIEDLLELFKHPVDGVRHQVRIELSERNTEEVIDKAQDWVNALDAAKKENALPILEILWLHQQHNIRNKELLVKVLQSPVEQARIAAQKVAWFWSDRDTHSRGGADSTISGMQFRTFYEPWWGNEVSSEESDVNIEKPLTDGKLASSEAEIPPSQRVVLDNKGVGPVKELNLPDDIDAEMVKEGKELFDTKCISCHIADKKLVGPAPKGILERRSPEWVMNMIINPTEMLEKDPLAQELLEEFNGTPMIEERITEKEARAILEYFRTL